MFNILGRKNDYVAPEKIQEPEPEVNLYESAPYTIGRNIHGMTQIVFRTAPGTTTLSLNPAGVREMIRMLESTLDGPNAE